jgi:hypothetical protein
MQRWILQSNSFQQQNLKYLGLLKANSQKLEEVRVVPGAQCNQDRKPCFGFQWVLQDPDLGGQTPAQQPPRKVNAPSEPGSYKEALLNFKVAILLGHPHHLF